MSYTFYEYPKALYLKGAYSAVKDAAEEAEMAALGWTNWQADQDNMAGVTAAIPEPQTVTVERASGFLPSPDAIGRNEDSFTFVEGGEEAAAIIPARKKPGPKPKAK